MKKLLLLPFGFLLCTQPLFADEDGGGGASNDKPKRGFVENHWGKMVVVTAAVVTGLAYYSSGKNYRQVLQEYEDVCEEMEEVKAKLSRRYLTYVDRNDLDNRYQALAVRKEQLESSLRRFRFFGHR